MNYSKDHKMQIYRKLPEKLQEAMGSVETTEKIQKIGKKYRLHVDILGKLVEEVGLVMLGLVKADEFSKHLESEMSLDGETARGVVQDLNKEVFFPIREYIHEPHEEKANLENHPLDRDRLLEEIEAEQESAGSAESKPQEEPAKPVFTGIHHGSLEKTSDKLEEKVSDKHFKQKASGVSTTPPESSESENETEQKKATGPRPYTIDPYRESVEG